MMQRDYGDESDGLECDARPDDLTLPPLPLYKRTVRFREGLPPFDTTIDGRPRLRLILLKWMIATGQLDPRD